MNNLNEYKLFKGTNKPQTRYGLVPPSDGKPYYGYGYDKEPVKDPDEPFFNASKRKYFTKKNDDVVKQQGELNKTIGIAKLREYGLTDEDFEKLKTLGEISNPTYYESEDTYNFWVRLHDSDYSVSFKYYIPEKDFIVISPDYITGKKALRKRFDNATDAINWAIQIKNTAKERRREMSRKVVQESNEPGLDVFGMKGIDKKLNNLIEFDDFDKTLKPKQQKSTKRTEVGLDILNESVVNKITLDVPLFIRMLEYAKEDAKTDMDLHKVTENILDMSADGKMLTMANYDSIVKIK